MRASGRRTGVAAHLPLSLLFLSLYQGLSSFLRLAIFINPCASISFLAHSHQEIVLERLRVRRRSASSPPPPTSPLNMYLLAFDVTRGTCSDHPNNTTSDSYLPPCHRQALPNFRWCAHAGCGAGQLHDGGDAAPILRCGKCGRKTCFTHRCEWHEDRTCSSYDAELQLSQQKSRRL